MLTTIGELFDIKARLMRLLHDSRDSSIATSRTAAYGAAASSFLVLLYVFPLSSWDFSEGAALFFSAIALPAALVSVSLVELAMILRNDNDFGLMSRVGLWMYAAGISLALSAFFLFLHCGWLFAVVFAPWAIFCVVYCARVYFSVGRSILHQP